VVNLCGVCDKPLLDHDKLNHEFTLNNTLIPKTTASHPQAVDKATLLRLALILFEKRIFKIEDLDYIFPNSGFNINSPPSD